MDQVLHILGSAQPEGAAFARIVGPLAAGLDPSRFRVHAWFLGGDGPLVKELQQAGGQVRVLPWRVGRRKPGDVWRFWRALREQKFAIIHHHVGGRLLSWLTRHPWDTRTDIHVHSSVTESEVCSPWKSLFLGLTP